MTDHAAALRAALEHQGNRPTDNERICSLGNSARKHLPAVLDELAQVKGKVETLKRHKLALGEGEISALEWAAKLESRAEAAESALSTVRGERDEAVDQLSWFAIHPNECLGDYPGRFTTIVTFLARLSAAGGEG